MCDSEVKSGKQLKAVKILRISMQVIVGLFLLWYLLVGRTILFEEDEALPRLWVIAICAPTIVVMILSHLEGHLEKKISESMDSADPSENCSDNGPDELSAGEGVP